MTKSAHIRALLTEGGRTPRQIAALVGCAPGHVRGVRSGDHAARVFDRVRLDLMRQRKARAQFEELLAFERQRTAYLQDLVARLLARVAELERERVAVREAA